MPFLLPILGMLFGLALASSAVLSRPWSRARAVVGLCIALGIAGVVWAKDRAYSQVELNPEISSPQRLAGAWRLGNTVLVLSAEGGWRCTGRSDGEPPCDGSARQGRWTLTDFVIHFSSLGGVGVSQLRVVSDRGRYRLLSTPNDDPDSWHVFHGYER